MNIAEVKTWALKGAEHRLVEIGEEARAIFRNFPELRGRGRGFDAEDANEQQSNTPARKRRKLSAEARKRISDAVKARWARQKERKAAGEVGTSQARETASDATAIRPPATKPHAGRRGGPRKMSAAARRRISAAAKARWAKFRRSRTRAGKKK